MSDERYSGNDPETGCGWMILALALGAVIVILGIATYLRLL